MSNDKTKKVTAVKDEPKKVETMSFVLTMPDGTIIEGSTALRPFQPNLTKKFQNTGFQVGITNGKYKGNLMLIDLDKQVRI